MRFICGLKKVITMHVKLDSRFKVRNREDSQV